MNEIPVGGNSDSRQIACMMCDPGIVAIRRGISIDQPTGQGGR